MALLENLSDHEIRSKLAELGHPVGPITETTRKIILKKLSKLLNEKKEVKPALKNAFKFSSAEESGSDNEQYGGLRKNKRISMPPPANYRARRKTNSKSSVLNSTVSDFRTNSSSDLFSSPSLSSGRNSRSRESLRGSRLSNYDFDSGSDSDVLETSFQSRHSRTLPNSRVSSLLDNSALSRSTSSSVTSSSLSKESRPFLSLTRRLNRYGNDAYVNDIKETDVDDGPSCATRPFSYKSFRSPVKPIFDRPPVTESRGIRAQFQQYGPMLLLSLFLLFFLWLAATYCLRVYFHAPLITGKQNHVYPICNESEIGKSQCIPPESMPFAVALYRSVHQLLLTRAVQSVCGPPLSDGSMVKPFMTERELVQYLLKSRPADVLRIEDGVKHLGLLLLSNPHWGVAVVRADDEEAAPTARCNIAESRKALPSDLATRIPLLFVTPCPELSFACRAKLFFFTFAYYITASLIVGAFMYGTYAGVRYYLRTVKEEEEQVIRLVERIMKQVTETCSSGQEFVAIRHVHDTIIPLAERARMASLWARAVEYLEKNEWRVRREVQTVYGEETAVWRLLFQSPNNSNPPSHISTPEPTDNHLYPDLSGHLQRENQRVWQGEAFETSEGSMNSVPVSPTPCLKIRHMFAPNKDYGLGWEVAVKDAIIEKCEGVKIVHVAVDKESKEGCVYLKCNSSQEAGDAYRRLHGSWFDGSLVTVKYLRLERYHERFPDSLNCKTSLRPSNNLRLSLGGKS